MKWLKLWDAVVFGKEKKVKVSQMKASDSHSHHPKKFTHTPFGAPDVITELDATGRPQQKVKTYVKP